MNVTPFSFIVLMIEKRFSISLSDSDDVGSSRITNFGFCENIFTISTICCSATERSLTFALGSKVTPSSFDHRSVSLFIFSKSRTPDLFLISLVRKTFSDTLRCGTRLFSWNTVPIPFPRVIQISRSFSSSPSKNTLPESSLRTPVRILINVDFPAPFSPNRQWTVPLFTENDTSSRA